MNNRHYWVFHGRLGTECEFALIAFRKMNETVAQLKAPWPSKELTQQFWYSVSGFLVAYANISKVLFPPDPLKSAKVSRQVVKKRGEDLRGILGEEVSAPFRERSIRDDFEHFDERLDEWFYLSKDHKLLDSSVIPEPLLAQFNPEDVLRNYVLDPDFRLGKYRLRFREKRIDLNELVDAIKKLQISLEQHPPNWQDGEYPVPQKRDN